MISRRWLSKRSWIIWSGIFILVLSSIMPLIGCTSTEKNVDPKTATVSEIATQATIVTVVSAQEAYMLIQEKLNDPDFTIIDVRTPDEYNTGHVKSAINIDYNSDSFKDRLEELDKTREYLVYCRSGNRSSGAIKIMEELDFSMIYHMNGGIIDWNSQGLPFER